MNEMIGQLLDLTQVESGTELITKTQIDLAALIERIAQDADYEARAIQRAVRVVQNQACETRGSIELVGSDRERYPCGSAYCSRD
jgi:signal transduction histidine kinase